MKKSKIIQELGLEILDAITKEQDSLKKHPLSYMFSEDSAHRIDEARQEEAEQIHDIVYRIANARFNQALKEEYETKS